MANVDDWTVWIVPAAIVICCAIQIIAYRRQRRAEQREWKRLQAIADRWKERNDAERLQAVANRWKERSDAEH